MFLLSSSQLQAAILFYRRYCAGSVIMTILCCALYAADHDIAAQYATKVVADAAILYFIFSLNRGRLYYYYNLHISRAALVVSFVITDLVIFSLSLWITSHII